VFLNFWATWCGPCRYELPDMETLLGENGDRLAVIAVNNGEDFGRARSYIDGLGVKLTAFAYDPKQDVVKLYGLYGMPTSFFIDQRGVITRVYPGQISLAIMRTAASEAIGASGAVGR
jgi:thiol-disulfide isomerase/thioredoxin